MHTPGVMPLYRPSRGGLFPGEGGRIVLTRWEKVLRAVSLLYALAFIGTTLVFILFPQVLFGIINGISGAVAPGLPPAADSGKFWLSMTVSMMVTITVLSLFIFRDVNANYRMAVPLAFAKFTSSLCGLGFFAAGFLFPCTKWNTLANLVIFITDFPLGVLILALYFKVKSGER